MFTKRYTFKNLVVAATLALACSTATADFYLPGSGGAAPIASVEGHSLTERAFENIIRQQFDFSCGSAALATMLTYHYEHPVGESEVFQWMYERGDKAKIKRLGFSMLDMKNYLEEAGFRGDGFKISLDKFINYRVPGIALINTNGYKHFVVVKGVEGDNVLLGDPALGMHHMSKVDFEKKWSGIVFLVRNHASVGRFYFNRDEDWGVLASSPMKGGLDAGNSGSLADFTLSLPQQGDF